MVVGIVGILVAIIIAIATYKAGVRQGRADEQDRRFHELAGKMVDEYVCMVRQNHASGPYALAKLGLHRLASDTRIRTAISEMEARTQQDPWTGHASDVAGVDLVSFFQHVSENNIDFAKQSIAETAATVRRLVGETDGSK